MIRPTPLGVGLFALSAPAAVLIVAFLPVYWYVSLYLPCLVGFLMLADLCLMLPARRLEIAVSAPIRLFIGHRGAVAVGLSCRGWKPATTIAAVAELTGEAETPVPVTKRFENGCCGLDIPEIPLRRGVIAIPTVHLRWRGPLRLVERLLRHKTDLHTEVVPDIHRVHDEALRFIAHENLYGHKSQRLHGEGSEFDKLSEYSPGMDTRHIDWKRSARHRKLLSKEFRQERNHQIILGLDTGHLMLERLHGVSRLDHSLRAGLLLSYISLHGGDLVGGIGFAARPHGFLQPGRGMPYFTHVQRFAAQLAYHTDETNFTLGLTDLNSRLKRRGLIILFSEFVDAISAELLLEGLQLLLRRHVVVFVTLGDPELREMAEAPPEDFHTAAKAVVANDFLRERAVVLERMARLGVHCLDAPPSRVGPALLNRYLLIKQKGIL